MVSLPVKQPLTGQHRFKAARAHPQRPELVGWIPLSRGGDGGEHKTMSISVVTPR